MSLITSEQCFDAICADLSWRKKELATIRRALLSESENRAALIRTAFVMLYAHWEGFVKFSAQAYVMHINERFRRYNAPLTGHFQNLLLWRCLKSVGEYPHHKNPVGFLRMQGEWINSRPNGLDEDMIDMESNLNSTVLDKILTIINLPKEDFASKSHLIDETLLGKRNPIAHGGRIAVSLDDYDEAERELQKLIELFQSKLVDCLVDASYAEKPAA